MKRTLIDMYDEHPTIGQSDRAPRSNPEQGGIESSFLRYQKDLFNLGMAESQIPQETLNQLRTGQLALCTVIHRRWPYSGSEFYLQEDLNTENLKRVDISFGIFRKPRSQLELSILPESPKPEFPEVCSGTMTLQTGLPPINLDQERRKYILTQEDSD